MIMYAFHHYVGSTAELAHSLRTVKHAAVSTYSESRANSLATAARRTLGSANILVTSGAHDHFRQAAHVGRRVVDRAQRGLHIRGRLTQQVRRDTEVHVQRSERL